MTLVSFIFIITNENIYQIGLNGCRISELNHLLLSWVGGLIEISVSVIALLSLLPSNKCIWIKVTHYFAAIADDTENYNLFTTNTNLSMANF